MTALKALWKKRITSLARQYYRMIAFQIDWIILLYSLVLLVLVGLGAYPTLLAFFHGLDKTHYRLLLTLLVAGGMLAGKERGYLKAADEVFFVPLALKGQVFTGYSLGLSRALALVGWTLFWAALALPLMLFNRAVPYQVLALWLAGGLLKLANMAFKAMIFHQEGRWRRRMYSWFRRVVFGGLALYLASDQGLIGAGGPGPWQTGLALGALALLFLLSGMIRRRLSPHWTRWITAEVNERVAWGQVLLKNPFPEKVVTGNRRPSRLSGRRGEPFSPYGALLLLYSRTLLRNRDNRNLLLQLAGAACLPFFFEREPLLIGLAMAFFLFLIGHFLGGHWKAFQDDPWLKLAPISLKDRMKALKTGPLWVGLALVALLSLVQLARGLRVVHPVLDPLLYACWLWLVVSLRTSFLLNHIK